MDKAFGRIQEFIRLETSGGIILMIAAVLAMIIANSPLATAYDAILGTYAPPRPTSRSDHAYKMAAKWHQTWLLSDSDHKLPQKSVEWPHKGFCRQTGHKLSHKCLQNGNAQKNGDKESNLQPKC